MRAVIRGYLHCDQCNNLSEEVNFLYIDGRDRGHYRLKSKVPDGWFQGQVYNAYSGTTSRVTLCPDHNDRTPEIHAEKKKNEENT